MNTRKACVSFAIVAALVLCLGGTVARAQDSKMDVFAGYSYSTNNCFESCDLYDPGLHGYALAFAYNLNHHIALEANFSGHNGTQTTYSYAPTSSDDGYKDQTNANVYTYVFGPRFSIPVGSFSLFAHVLVGAAHVNATDSETCIPATGTGDVETCGTPVVDHYVEHGSGFATKAGGGVNWNHKRWGIRILEANFVHGEVNTSERYDSGEVYQYVSSGNGFELSTGVTVYFGSMK